MGIIQKVEAVEQLDKRLYSGDRNETVAVIEAVMAEGSLQLHSKRWVNIPRRVLHILDLVGSDPDVDALVSSSITALDVNGSSLIGVIDLDDPEFVVLLGC